MEEDHRYTSICSAATLQSNKKGFFQSYADNVIGLAGQSWLDQFKLLRSDSERLLKCYNDDRLQEAVHGVLGNVQPVFRGKTGRLSQLRRMEGEKALRDGKLKRALLLLTQAVVKAPGPGVDPSVDDGHSLLLALWSRIQTLWQLSEYRLCLGDVQYCVKEKLPEKYRLEAYWHMAQCYKRLGEPARARVALQVGLKLAGPADIDWKHKLEGELINLSPVEEKTPEEQKDNDVLLDGPHPQLPGLSAALAVRSGQLTGRYVVARQRVSSGDVLAVEPAYVACLHPDKFGSHCHHCFTRLTSAVACGTCSGVAYCSLACRESAHRYHRYECQYLDLMIGSGMSILCYIALRTVTRERYSYWQRVRAHQPVAPDYNRLAGLVTHADKREPGDFVSRTLMSLFLLRLLEHSQYIPPADCDTDTDRLTGMRLFLGSVLLHLLQCLQFNAHEIYETLYKSELDFSKSKVHYIGVGVYPSVALFNHDCYPAVTRYFRGSELVVRAVRPLRPGDIVAENYGPVYTMRSRAERQRSLTSRYWFNCVCTACVEDWPKLADFDESIIYLRCKAKDCEGYVRTSVEPSKPRVPCPRCGATVTLSEGARLVKSYQTDYESGLALMAEGRLLEAAQVFCAYSDAMHVVCRPPVKSVSLAHETMRSCYSYPHNKHIVN